MKATLYRLPTRYVLALTDETGTRVEYATTETRASQLAQDAGASTVQVVEGLPAGVLAVRKDQKVKMV